MIVQRITAYYKPGKVSEGIALIKAEITNSHFPHTTRIYTPQLNPSNMSIGEFEFESVAEMEQYWSHWETRPETAVFHEKYRLLIEPDMVSEIFDLH
ncbi:hypothetical protein BH10CHL1_BH10CHL1_03970 [soil metagenome]